MAAMRVDAVMQFDLLWVAISVVIAMTVASVALRFYCSALAGESRNLSQSKITGAVLMGGAIGGMHYTGMAAVTFFSTATPYQRTSWQFSEVSLAMLATVAMLLTLVIFILTSTELKRRMFGIAQKVTLLSAVIILSAVTIVGQVAYREATDLLLELELHKTSNEIDIHAIDTKTLINGLQKDARFLAATPPIAGIMRAGSDSGMDTLDRSTGSQWRGRLQKIFSYFLLSRPEYKMIRFIGLKNSGRELVRVERRVDGKVYVQPEHLLQSKAHRDYFIKTLKVPAGRVYLSEINYDREFGKLVQPYQPVMRTSIPVYNSSGKMFGMVVINMDMKPLLSRWGDLDSDSDLDRAVNERGDYLVHPDPNMVFGFELGERYRVQDEFPELSSLLSPDSDSLFATFKVNEHGNPAIAIARKITFDSLHPERFIILIELTSPDHKADQATPILRRISIFGQFIIAFAILIAFFLSTLLMRPLRLIIDATEAFADGSSQLILPLEDQSEIGDLARTFKAMTTQINERSSELRLSGQVFESALEGILVTDIDGVILSVNPAFTAITGYSEAEVVGGNPRLIKSGHHDAGFYESMWKDVLETGKWQGELWNRRKSGETYPVWETITAIKGDDGETTHYVAIFFDITERKQADERLQYQAQHDVLTGLPNRMLFNDLLEQILKEEERSKGGVAVLFMDLDRFKEVNDTLGHQAGDLLLQEATQRLEKVIRSSDVLARMGGDEFTLILRDISSINDASHIAEKIITAMNEPFLLEEHEASIGASIGISVYPNDAEDAGTLIKYADTAMYRVKDSGRNNFQFFTASMGEDLELRLQMKAAIDGAIKNKEFELYFQPKVNLASGECVGAEALIR
ncbi:MAG: diguanylate cyclase, partial [Mariprofundaceae bacterium]